MCSSSTTPRLKPSDATWPGEPPEVSLVSQGYQYLTETRLDQMEPILETVRRDIIALGLPLRSVEIELGPSQCEFTFHPQVGLSPADTMMLFRSAVKQICRRHGYHASFMARPKVANVLSSGWHLHQSLRDRRSDTNAFMSDDKELLSRTGCGFLAGLVSHARAAAAFTTPTINGYKRYRSYSLAPDRAIWARDNRGVMIRVLGGPGDPATRLENRVGEPAANPYLYMASQIVTGLDGMKRMLDPWPVGGYALRGASAAVAEDPRRGARRVANRRLPRRRLRQEFHRLLPAHQGGRDRALQRRGHGMGAAGIFRAVLGADPKRGSERGETHRHRKSPI